MTNNVITKTWYSAKGGEGCTVTCARAALAHGGPVALRDLTGTGDLAAVFGVCPPDDDGPPVEAAPGVLLIGTFDLAPVGSAVFYDAGVQTAVPSGDGVLVVRNSYLSLRRAVRMTGTRAGHPNGRHGAVVAVMTSGGALRGSDIMAALGVPEVTVLAVDPAIARAVDAGILAGRGALRDDAFTFSSV